MPCRVFDGDIADDDGFAVVSARILKKGDSPVVDYLDGCIFNGDESEEDWDLVLNM